jgi:hypothetical protein
MELRWECYAQRHMRSIRRTVRGPSVLLKTQRNREFLLRTRFTSFWRIEIHINLKIDADALNRRRRRFLRRCPIRHICQGQWRHYARKCACVYDVWNVKNKVQNSSIWYRQYLLWTNLIQPNRASLNLNSPNSFKLHNRLYYRKHNGIEHFYYEHVSQRGGEVKSISN